MIICRGLQSLRSVTLSLKRCIWKVVASLIPNSFWTFPDHASNYTLLIVVIFYKAYTEAHVYLSVIGEASGCNL